MKKYKELLIPVAMLLLPLSRPVLADEVNEYVGNELQLMQTTIQSELERTDKKIADLQAAKESAINRSKISAENERSAIDLLKTFSILIQGRYVNEQGEYQDGLELNEKDRRFLNLAFNKYLHTTPIQEKTSTGEARRTIDWGVKRLQEVAKIHAEPTEMNNSDLELIALNLKQSQKTRKRFAELAERLSASSEAKMAGGNKGSARTPASQ